jgi:hypothetical protein
MHDPAIPAAAPQAVSAARAARRSPQAKLALVLGALVLPIPVLLWLMQSGVVDPSIDAATWLKNPLLGGIHAVTGLPAAVSSWLLPLLVFAIAWGLRTGFERIAARIDPHDRGWTSFTWALRSWRGASWWLAIVLVPTLAIAAAWTCLSLTDARTVSDGLGLDDAKAFAGLLWLSLPFFVFDSRNLGPAVPPRRWSARWPTRQALILVGAMLVALGLFLVFDTQAWIDAQRKQPDGFARMLGLLAIGWPLSLLLTWMLELAWLSRAGWSGLPGVWRRGLHPRVLATLALQWTRPALVFALSLLPLIAWAWFFVSLNPVAEDALRDHGAHCCETWQPLIESSRFLVAWWWMLALAVLMVVQLLAAALLPWFGGSPGRG